MSKLTNKQRAFVAEYLVSLNATQAAIRAGYSRGTAGRMGAENLSKPVIAAAIQQAMDERAARTGITADMVVRRLAEIGFGDVRRCFNADGELILPQDMPDDVAALLAGIEVKTVSLGAGKVEHVAKIKTRDTVRALELLGKHTGAWEQHNKQKRLVVLTEAEAMV
jgi:phage terminase small subunit